MKVYSKNAVFLPPALSLLVTARARAQGTRVETVLRESVTSFAYLSQDTRSILLYELHWSRIEGEDWIPYHLDKDTLDIARMARVGTWARQQVILAAVAWFLAAY